jgi:hypothetical protein
MLEDYDVLVVFKRARYDRLSVAALSMALMVGGATKNVMTTQLMPWSERLEAMKKIRCLTDNNHMNAATRLHRFEAVSD